MTFTDLTSIPADRPALVTDQLRLALAAYLAWLGSPAWQTALFAPVMAFLS
jgi:hypothetical protein